MKSNLINEVFWLRSIACLAVTFGHAQQLAFTHFTEPSIYHTLSYFFYMLVLFGVPVFVFISEFLLGNKYSHGVPPGFLLKRTKILIAPYVFINIIFAFFDTKEWNMNTFLIETFKNIFLGHSTIYFVLIIFQFYLLHIFLSKYLNKISFKIALPAALIINLFYLAIFNFTEPPNNPYVQYVWNPGYWMPFTGWIFYFVLGFYCGRNYEKVMNNLKKYGKLMLIMPIITFTIMIFMNKYFFISQDSKRIDMLLFATSMIFVIMYLASFIKSTPKVVMLISNYSFSIFLLNEVFFLLFHNIQPLPVFNVLSYSVFAFTLSIFCSIGTSYLINKMNFGKYLVGNIMYFGVDDRTVKKSLKSVKNSVKAM
jgi:membrane-bound acyltransferase YfiQ involved in biofilm formation